MQRWHFLNWSFFSDYYYVWRCIYDVGSIDSHSTDGYFIIIIIITIISFLIALDTKFPRAKELSKLL